MPITILTTPIPILNTVTAPIPSIIILLFWERGGVVVMVIQSLLLKSSLLPSGKGKWW